MLTKQKLKSFAKSRGADLIGVSSWERFEEVPKEENPLSIFPDAKSIIVVGCRILRGSLRGIEEGTYWPSYTHMSYGGINLYWMPTLLRDLAIFLEDRGYEAVPVPHIQYNIRLIQEHGKWRYTAKSGDPVSPDRPAPDIMINYRRTAVTVGLGEIGHSKIFLSPQFGPRQRFGILITDAVFESDPLWEGKICDHCLKCVEECPGDAISKDDTVRAVVAGKEVKWGKLDILKCLPAYLGLVRKVSPFISDNLVIAENVNPRTAIFEASKSISYFRDMRATATHACSICGARGCIRACMDHLEKTGRIEAKFRNPFRKKKPWLL